MPVPLPLVPVPQPSAPVSKVSLTWSANETPLSWVPQTWSPSTSKSSKPQALNSSNTTKPRQTWRCRANQPSTAVASSSRITLDGSEPSTDAPSSFFNFSVPMLSPSQSLEPAAPGLSTPVDLAPSEYMFHASAASHPVPLAAHQDYYQQQQASELSQPQQDVEEILIRPYRPKPRQRTTIHQDYHMRLE
ncbi:hypothetical protein BC835DRAFT_1423645 [Cytidiella melzeri]|nr:hypothetical protein BC835DRAFT_1423645 [Cytidiella melzeri]